MLPNPDTIRFHAEVIAAEVERIRNMQGYDEETSWWLGASLHKIEDYASAILANLDPIARLLEET